MTNFIQSIEITQGAQDYLADLLSKQSSTSDNESDSEAPKIGVRIFVEKPGTPYAECCMAYCAHGEELETDEKIVLDQFTAFIDSQSLPYLEDAKVDYAKERLGGQLTFKAPKSKVPQVNMDDASTEEMIHYILQTEINPQLASHGGNVQLMDLLDNDTVAVLQFGGGCQGCGMVDMTLKGGVEKTLLEKVPALKKVTDMTDHSVTENAYYKDASTGDSATNNQNTQDMQDTEE